MGSSHSHDGPGTVFGRGLASALDAVLDDPEEDGFEVSGCTLDWNRLGETRMGLSCRRWKARRPSHVLPALHCRVMAVGEALEKVGRDTEHFQTESSGIST